MKKIISTLVVVLAFVLTAAAQNRTVTGVVTSDKGQPVSGVSVTTPDGKVGTQTDNSGKYSIIVGADVKSLIFSSVNYNSITQIIAGNTANVSLSVKNSDMDEVVVIAYGTVKKGEATSAIVSVNADAIKNRPLTNVTSALEGAAPGIQMLSANGQPGSGQTIRLRGFGSISASNSPLFVVDGVPYDGAISDINMDDVESVNALKDAGSTALYGSRASNGVVIITTKKGRKNRNNIGFKATYGLVNRGLNEYERVNAYDYYPIVWQAYRNSLVYNSGQTMSVANQNATNSIKGLLAYNPFNVANNAIVDTNGKLNPNARLLYPEDLDWSKGIIRQGTRNEYALNYNGGNDKSDYYGSFGYTKEQGFSIKSDLSKFNGRLGVNVNPVKWFKTGLNIAGSMSQANTANDDASTSYVNPFNFIRNIGSIYPVYAHNTTNGDYLLNSNGDRLYDYGNLNALGIANRPSGASPGRHIHEETNLNVNIFKRNLLNARAYGTINFTQDLSFTTNISLELTNYSGSVYGNRIIGDAAPNGRSSKEYYTRRSYTFNQLLEYSKSIQKHNFSVLAGHENYDYNYNNFFGNRSSQIFDGNIELPNFAIAGTITSYEDNQRIESYLSRVSYDYAGKYFITGSLRRDGNSRFKKEVREENFWSVGGAWRLDKEAFMQNIPQVNLLKLRSSYGKLGNDAGISFYAYQGLYALGNNNASEPGVLQSNLQNDSIKWETSKNFDAAIEFGLFKGRINGSFEYYKKTTDGLIFSVPQPLSNGGTTGGGYTILKNVGQMYNKGIEAHLDADVIRTQKITWNVGVNATTVENRITKMPDGQKEIISGTKKLAVGHSIYDFWLRDWQGVDPADGAALYRADNGLAAGSRVRGAGDTVTINQNNGRFLYQGSAIPKVFGSITSSLKYSGFELNVLMSYQIGGKIYDAIYAGLMDNGATYGSALHADALKSWQKPGDITNVPRMDNSKGGVFNAASSRWLIDASYFNIRNIGLSYTFNSLKIGGVTANNTRFFLNAENVMLFSERTGLNPQQAFSGVTSNAYPPSRVFSMGINVNF